MADPIILTAAGNSKVTCRVWCILTRLPGNYFLTPLLVCSTNCLSDSTKPMNVVLTLMVNPTFVDSLPQLLTGSPSRQLLIFISLLVAYGVS
jgi:hypothetical protein